LREKVRDLEAKVEEVKRKTAARLLEAEAEVFAVRRKAKEESCTLNARVWAWKLPW
jgi:hypothetical protein